jgi:hypothetical protein
MPVAATIVGDDGVRAGAVLASRATCTPSAGVRQRSMTTHHLQLAEAHVTAVGITPRRAVIAEDVCDLESGTAHAGGLKPPM